jgi:hypothetical protein
MYEELEDRLEKAGDLAQQALRMLQHLQSILFELYDIDEEEFLCDALDALYGDVCEAADPVNDIRHNISCLIARVEQQAVKVEAR